MVLTRKGGWGLDRPERIDGDGTEISSVAFVALIAFVALVALVALWK